MLGFSVRNLEKGLYIKKHFDGNNTLCAANLTGEPITTFLKKEDAELAIRHCLGDFPPGFWSIYAHTATTVTTETISLVDPKPTDKISAVPPRSSKKKVRRHEF